MNEFHSQQNYVVLKDVVKEMFPVDTVDSFQQVFDLSFKTYTPLPETTLVGANKHFLKYVVQNLQSIPKKINILDFEKVDAINYDVLKLEIDDPRPSQIQFHDSIDDDVSTTPLHQLVENAISVRQLDIQPPMLQKQQQQEPATIQNVKKVHFEETILDKLVTIRKLIDDVIVELSK